MVDLYKSFFISITEYTTELNLHGINFHDDMLDDNGMHNNYFKYITTSEYKIFRQIYLKYYDIVKYNLFGVRFADEYDDPSSVIDTVINMLAAYYSIFYVLNKEAFNTNITELIFERLILDFTSIGLPVKDLSEDFIRRTYYSLNAIVRNKGNIMSLQELYAILSLDVTVNFVYVTVDHTKGFVIKFKDIQTNKFDEVNVIIDSDPDRFEFFRNYSIEFYMPYIKSQMLKYSYYGSKYTKNNETMAIGVYKNQYNNLDGVVPASGEQPIFDLQYNNITAGFYTKIYVANPRMLSYVSDFAPLTYDPVLGTREYFYDNPDKAPKLVYTYENSIHSTIGVDESAFNNITYPVKTPFVSINQNIDVAKYQDFIRSMYISQVFHTASYILKLGSVSIEVEFPSIFLLYNYFSRTITDRLSLLYKDVIDNSLNRGSFIQTDKVINEFIDTLDIDGNIIESAETKFKNFILSNYPPIADEPVTIPPSYTNVITESQINDYIQVLKNLYMNDYTKFYEYSDWSINISCKYDGEKYYLKENMDKRIYNVYNYCIRNRLINQLLSSGKVIQRIVTDPNDPSIIKKYVYYDNAVYGYYHYSDNNYDLNTDTLYYYTLKDSDTTKNSFLPNPVVLRNEILQPGQLDQFPNLRKYIKEFMINNPSKTEFDCSCKLYIYNYLKDKGSYLYGIIDRYLVDNQEDILAKTFYRTFETAYSNIFNLGFSLFSLRWSEAIEELFKFFVPLDMVMLGSILFYDFSNINNFQMMYSAVNNDTCSVDFGKEEKIVYENYDGTGYLTSSGKIITLSGSGANTSNMKIGTKVIAKGETKTIKSIYSPVQFELDSNPSEIWVNETYMYYDYDTTKYRFKMNFNPTNCLQDIIWSELPLGINSTKGYVGNLNDLIRCDSISIDEIKSFNSSISLDKDRGMFSLLETQYSDEINETNNLFQISQSNISKKDIQDKNILTSLTYSKYGKENNYIKNPYLFSFNHSNLNIILGYTLYIYYKTNHLLEYDSGVKWDNNLNYGGNLWDYLPANISYEQLSIQIIE